MKDETRKLLLSALAEASFVVFGVVLALLANEWRQEVANRQAGEAALASIFEELRQNRDAVAASYEYHNSLMATIGTALEEGEPLSGRDFPRGFVSTATTFKTAWEMAGQAHSPTCPMTPACLFRGSTRTRTDMSANPESPAA